MSWGLIDRVRS